MSSINGTIAADLQQPCSDKNEPEDENQLYFLQGTSSDNNGCIDSGEWSGEMFPSNTPHSQNIMPKLLER